MVLAVGPIPGDVAFAPTSRARGGLMSPAARPPAPTFSAGAEYPAADPADAERHFLARLAGETDVSDVVHDLSRGTGKVVLLDVRDADEYAVCHAAGAVS